MEDLKFTVARNLVQCRRACGYTQLQVAEKLNYSDKAVSKWERGESLPDVAVLTELARLLAEDVVRQITELRLQLLLHLLAFGTALLDLRTQRLHVLAGKGLGHLRLVQAQRDLRKPLLGIVQPLTGKFLLGSCIQQGFGTRL